MRGSGSFRTRGLFQHPSDLDPEGAVLAKGRDHAVHIGGGFHRENEVMAGQGGARKLFRTVRHTRGQRIADQVAMASANRRILPQDGKILPHPIPHDRRIAAADLAADGHTPPRP